MPTGVYPRKDINDRFFEKVSKSDACWVWIGAKRHGYGAFGVGRKSVPAHRMSLLLAGKSIPDGYDVDHLCRNPECVNPEHLEAVTHRENVQRGLAGEHMKHKQATRTTCKKGHPSTPNNSRWRKDGKWKSCRICERDSQRLRRSSTC